jgi:hypothetical protein
MQTLGNTYPNIGDLIRSTFAALLNAFQAGYLSLPELRVNLVGLDLPKPALDLVLEIPTGSIAKATHC